MLYNVDGVKNNLRNISELIDYLEESVTKLSDILDKLEDIRELLANK